MQINLTFLSFGNHWIVDLHLKVDCRPPHQDVTLQVKVRELPTESTAKEITAKAIKQAAEKYKQESLLELQRMETDIAYFSNVLMDRDVSHISATFFFNKSNISHFKRFAAWSIFCMVG